MSAVSLTAERHPEVALATATAALRVAVAGKGGAGKSVLSGTLARLLARDGRNVLALDSDLLPGLEITLGAKPPQPPPLMEAAIRGENGRWRLAPGVGPVRAVQRYATPAPDGVRLLQCGKAGPTGTREIMPAIQAFYMTVHGIGHAAALREWHFVGDLPAGPRQVGYGWAPYAERLLLVAEPSSMSLLAARRTARVGSELFPGLLITLVASKVRSPEDVRRIEAFLDLRATAVVPLDPLVAEAERAGVPLIDHAPQSPAATAIADLAAWLGAQERPTAAPEGATR